jgi:hypothetical protein
MSEKGDQSGEQFSVGPGESLRIEYEYDLIEDSSRTIRPANLRVTKTTKVPVQEPTKPMTYKECEERIRAVIIHSLQESDLPIDELDLDTSSLVEDVVAFIYENFGLEPDDPAVEVKA